MSPTSEQIYTYRMTRKVRAGGSGCAALGFGFLGLCCLISVVAWPLGLLFFIIGFLVDAKSKHISICGYCGNEVAHTSTLCPTCHADLAEPTAAMRRQDTLKQFAKTGLILLIITAGIVFIVAKRHSSRDHAGARQEAQRQREREASWSAAASLGATPLSQAGGWGK